MSKIVEWLRYLFGWIISYWKYCLNWAEFVFKNVFSTAFGGFAALLVPVAGVFVTLVGLIGNLWDHLNDMTVYISETVSSSPVSSAASILLALIDVPCGIVCVSAVFSMMIGVVGYRFIKSWIPTVSG